MATAAITLRNGARISLVRTFPFFAVHLACMTVFFLGFRWSYLIVCLALFYVRMFFVTAGYHRYFSHRAFKTSRAFQFIIAVMATTSTQKGVLWWPRTTATITATPTRKRTCTRPRSSASGGRMWDGFCRTATTRRSRTSSRISTNIRNSAG